MDISTIGDRLRHARGLTKLTRKELSQKYGVPIDTLVSWEIGRTKPTENSLKRILSILAEEGVIASRAWVLTGTGLLPKHKNDISLLLKKKNFSQEDINKLDDESLANLQVKLFLENTPNSVAMLVTSEDMSPFYYPDDYIGGIYKEKPGEIRQCVGLDCIVLTTTDEKFFRRLVRSNDNDGYNLVCLNPALGSVHEPVLYDVGITKVAPVIWHRRPDVVRKNFAEEAN